MTTYIIPYIVFFSIMHRLRGHHFYGAKDDYGTLEGRARYTLDKLTNKTMVAIYVLVASSAMFDSIIVGIIIGLGYRLEVSLGRGLYNVAFTGDLTSFFKRTKDNVVVRFADNRVKLDTEISIIDRLADRISSHKKINFINVRRVTEGLMNTGGIPALEKDRLVEAAYRWGWVAGTLRALIVLVISIGLMFVTKSMFPVLVGFAIALIEGYTFYALRRYYKKFRLRWEQWFYRGKKGKEPANYTLGIIEFILGAIRGAGLEISLLI